MIIDIHGHVSAPKGLYAYKSLLLSSRGSHGRGHLNFSEADIRDGITASEAWGSHFELMKSRGIDFQLISPRPFQLMHSERPGKIVHWWHEENHNVIAAQLKLFPDKFAGVCALPQVAGAPIEEALPELERCVKELGFVGCLVNSDPFENSGVEAPGMGDRYWWPLYRKLCELDVPAMLHGAGSKSEKTSYSTHFINEETSTIVHMLNSDVFDEFPTLKFIVPHGGGAVPYQLGRFESTSLRAKRSFSDKMRNMWFDTTLYTREALELLLRVVGPDRCMFATECPGTGTSMNPKEGRFMDDIVPFIRGFDFLSDAQKTAVFEGNARTVFKLKVGG